MAPVTGMKLRLVLAVLVLGLSGWVIFTQLQRLHADTSVWPPDDFVEYWCAGWLNWNGENPYDPVRMYQLEQEIGWDIGQAIMMWNPPWTLSLAMPLSWMPWRTAQFVWLFLKLAILIYCAVAVWNLYGGSKDKVGIAVLVTLGFFPTMVSFHSGQISPFLLLGAVLFLQCETRGYLIAAGFVCVFLAIKPHLAYLVWLAVVCHALQYRQPRIVIGGILGGVIGSIWPVAINPEVYSQYFEAARNHPPAQWMSPTLGTVLRLIWGADQFWLQYVPMAFGLAWFARIWMRYRHAWDWRERLPGLIWVSFVAAPYGAWPYDLVLLLLPILRIASKLTQGYPGRTLAIGGFVAINAGMIGINILQITSVWFIWVAPTLLLLAWLVERTWVQKTPAEAAV